LKASIFFIAPLLVVNCFAGTVYNNYTSDSDYWHPFGSAAASGTPTYGETFTAPTNGDTNLSSFSLYMGSPDTAGTIVLHGGIGTWTGSAVGSVLYASPTVNYANSGFAQLIFNTGGLQLTGGATYLMFITTLGEAASSGAANTVPGTAAIPGGSFAYNNGNDLGSGWSSSLTPDLAVTASFDAGGSAAPEPGSLTLFGAGIAGVLFLRRRPAR
jgi:hypothetical protein